ncbi:MAG: saccharopine dehydrogenase-like oxidoreductase [Candidatus Omnitrophica bacterium]|nr:saccharopine dehydrogenase-like oxidoreductase [Candidatus Omnitrophota bacterium]
MKQIRVAVLGAGGLGKSAAKIIGMKKEMKLVSICDRNGVLQKKAGLDIDAVYNLPPEKSVGDLPGGRISKDSIGDVIAWSHNYDGVFIALPNMPNDFIPGVIKRFIKKRSSVCFTDALKRTTAMKLMFKLHAGLKGTRSVYITGCGATPGLLSAAAVIAAQSFVKVDKVDIWWGVGISNWEAYRATIREDIAHLPGWDLKKAKALTDSEVDELLDKTNGRLEFHGMEHADDLLLEKVGVVDNRRRVSVGGIMDTRSAKKPVSTTMTLTGTTFDGKKSSHKFILGDETSMAANVIGPALGYLKQAYWLKSQKIFGMFGSTEFMPKIVH